jgi:hypothetical protein
MSSKAMTTFRKLSDGNFGSQAKVILDSLSDNFLYPNPSPSLTELADACDEYATLLKDARAGTRSAIAAKNSKKAEITKLLIRLVGYVNLTANGNRDMLLTTGFEITKQKEPAPSLAKPVNLKIVNGENAGEVIMGVDKVPGALTYMHQYTPDPMTGEDNWESKITSTCRTTITGLEPTKKYWFRVAAVGTKDQLVFSDPVAIVVR